MANNLNLLRSLHLLLSTFFCLHRWASNGISISRVKYNALRKFSGQNIFVIKRIDENFLRQLFGIEINANENKANYGICIHEFPCTSYWHTIFPSLDQATQISYYPHLTFPFFSTVGRTSWKEARSPLASTSAEFRMANPRWSSTGAVASVSSCPPRSRACA